MLNCLFCNLYCKTDASVTILLVFSVHADNKMAVKVFFSQNKCSCRECDSLTLCNMHLTTCNMQKILHDYSNLSEWGPFKVYDKNVIQFISGQSIFVHNICFEVKEMVKFS